METLISSIIGIAITAPFLLTYMKRMKKKETLARAAEAKGLMYSEGPQAQHPYIDAHNCIGCGSCTTVCPEGDVLAMLGGKAVIVNAYKCIGHGLCADACPTGAITMVQAKPSVGANMPYLTPAYETSMTNMFIVGELGGLALIKNAVNQGRDCIDTIASRRQSGQSDPEVFDVLIVGAGAAGISASLRAIEKKLRYVTIEQGEVGGTVAKYPRQKLVMTSPVEFPMYGKFKELELSKEKLLEFWNKVMQRADFKVNSGEKVQDIQKGPAVFTIVTTRNTYRARAVVLALGRTGTPRKLGVKGEELPKVMYRLLEADHYINKHILVVGGGDSAIEAAMGLAEQHGNTVTLSYRKEGFGRIKERNARRVEECMRKGKVKVLFESGPVEFKEKVVLLDVKGSLLELPNDFVWIFAGGEAPFTFLKKIGIQFGDRDMTLDIGQESRLVARAAYSSYA